MGRGGFGASSTPLAGVARGLLPQLCILIAASNSLNSYLCFVDLWRISLNWSVGSVSSLACLAVCSSSSVHIVVSAILPCTSVRTQNSSRLAHANSKLWLASFFTWPGRRWSGNPSRDQTTTPGPLSRLMMLCSNVFPKYFLALDNFLRKHSIPSE